LDRAAVNLDFQKLILKNIFKNEAKLKETKCNIIKDRGNGRIKRNTGVY
jgi:hypothetical protein